MIFSRAILAVLGAAVGVAALAAAVAPFDDAQADAKAHPTDDAAAMQGSVEDAPLPPRPVILRVNRNLEINGHIEEEDDDIIVVQTTRGRIETFPKSRLLQIVRLVTPEPGQRGVVYLRNGQVREGVIIEDAFDHVTIEIEGIRARLRREVVDRVALRPTFDQQYRDFKATLGPRMSERHLMLCRWLVENRRYDMARQELLEVIENSEQEIPEARNLLRLVEAQLSIQAAAASAIPAEEVGHEPAIEQEKDLDRGRILTREEVNLMRVYEIDFDHAPRVVVSQDTIRRMIEKHSASPVIPSSQAERNALFRADPLDIVRMLFKLRARELYGEVQVLNEPQSLNLFRTRVHDGWLMQTCATSACHGGKDAGDLLLHRSGHHDERVRYTNLLILERLDVHPEHRLINYEDPEMSLIIQYAMPRNVARLPHPDVRGWRPAFTRGNDRMKQDTIRWIKSMMQPRPNYQIEYEPPRPSRDADPSRGSRPPR